MQEFNPECVMWQESSTQYWSFHGLPSQASMVEQKQNKTKQDMIRISLKNVSLLKNL
jgi:hypothetical protein